MFRTGETVSDIYRNYLYHVSNSCVNQNDSKMKSMENNSQSGENPSIPFITDTACIRWNDWGVWWFWVFNCKARNSQICHSYRVTWGHSQLPQVVPHLSNSLKEQNRMATFYRQLSPTRKKRVEVKLCMPGFSPKFIKGELLFHPWGRVRK